MFCSKCGRRINSKEDRCPDCGAITAIEYCGGFWGLVGTDITTQAASPPLEVVNVPEDEDDKEEIKKKPFDISRNVIVVLAAISICLAGMCFWQHNKISDANNEIRTMNKVLRYEKRHSKEIEQENNILLEQKKAAEAETEKVNAEIAVLKGLHPDEDNTDDNSESDTSSDNDGSYEEADAVTDSIQEEVPTSEE